MLGSVWTSKYDFADDLLSPHSCTDLYGRVTDVVYTEFQIELKWVSLWISKQDFSYGPLNAHFCMDIYVRVKDMFCTGFQTDREWASV